MFRNRRKHDFLELTLMRRFRLIQMYECTYDARFKYEFDWNLLRDSSRQTCCRYCIFQWRTFHADGEILPEAEFPILRARFDKQDSMVYPNHELLTFRFGFFHFVRCISSSRNRHLYENERGVDYILHFS